MANLTTALNTAFTPAASDFDVQCSGAGLVWLQRRNNSGAAWVNVLPALSALGSAVVSNPVAGADYRFISDTPGVSVSADQ